MLSSKLRVRNSASTLLIFFPIIFLLSTLKRVIKTWQPGFHSLSDWGPFALRPILLEGLLSASFCFMVKSYHASVIFSVTFRTTTFIFSKNNYSRVLECVMITGIDHCMHDRIYPATHRVHKSKRKQMLFGILRPTLSAFLLSPLCTVLQIYQFLWFYHFAVTKRVRFTKNVQILKNSAFFTT